MRLVLFGTPAYAVPSLEALAASRHEVALVVAQPDRAAGRSRRLMPPPVAARARELGLDLVQPEKPNARAARERIASCEADLFCVVAYGHVLRERLLAVPARGAINAHGSLLPRWRGAAPVARAILAGDETTGVSVQVMAREVDAGDVLLAREERVRPDDTTVSLSGRLARLSAALLVEAAGAIESGEAHATSQDASRVTLAPKLAKREAEIDWSRPAAETERAVRAFQPWPVAFTFVEKGGRRRRLQVLGARVEKNAGGAGPGTVLAAGEEGLLVAAGGGALRLTRLKPEGGKACEAAAFLRGHAVAPGERLG